MELEKYKRAKDLQDKIESLERLFDCLITVRDFTKTDMCIVFREHGKEGTTAYTIPPFIVEHVCARLRQDIRTFEANLTDEFYKL